VRQTAAADDRRLKRERAKALHYGSLFFIGEISPKSEMFKKEKKMK
jgi:hypothetical protein